MEILGKFDVKFDKELAIDMVLNSLLTGYDPLILTYHMNNTEMKLTPQLVAN